jgi:DNA polymerase-4
MQILGRYSPTVEPLSLDEAFLDTTGTEALFGTPAELAWTVQRAVREELALPCSVGVASNKFVAKVASDFRKPAGIVVVTPGEEATFLAPMAVERLWGVGPKTAERLRADGYTLVGEVAAAELVELQRRYGNLGQHLHALANGNDDRPVDDERERKSLGAERTLDIDIVGVDAVRHQLIPLIDEVAQGLRKAGMRAGGVRLKLKYSDFHRVSREHLLAEPALDAASLRVVIEQLLTRVETNRPMRLVGLAATHLVAADAPRQTSLFDAPQANKSEALGRALDAINGKHGKHAVIRGNVRRLDGIDRGVEHLED